jgi:outer membrane lipoprotein-sorting protein
MKPRLCLAIVLLAGCAAREKLPVVPWGDRGEALDILARRSDAIQTISAQGLITFVRPDGESVRLDLVMLRRNDHSLRLRAWKLSRTVFDLTVNPDGIWLLAARDHSIKDKSRAAGLTARKLADTLELFSGAFFRRSDLQIEETPAALIASDSRVRCEVERRTLTPRRYILRDDAGVARFTLDLSDYRMISDHPLPYRYTATSSDGRIIIALREVELNSELAEGAFVPPKRAEKLP